jgi:sugar lactone lactonase YvrE
MRRKIIACVAAAAALLGTSLAEHADAKKDPVFADGGVLAGSTNGISFDPTDGSLWVANVFGATITQIDPETGAILDQLTAANGVAFPDDLIVASNGDIYWTEIVFGAIFKKPADGPTEMLVPPGGLNSANPLTLSEDETRLFAAGCYGGPPANNSFVEIDLDTGAIINTYRDGIVGCASNGMSWYDGNLYSPQPFEDRILRVNPDSGEITVVTDDWPTPIGTAFDSQGNLYSLAQGVGEVVRIDINDPDVLNNRTVIADIPFGWADNIAINDDDRIFISSASDSSISEVLDDGTLREVVPGQFQLAGGVSVIGDTVYGTHPAGIVGFDRKTGEQTSHHRSPAGVGDLPFVLSSTAWGENLVLMSAFGGEILLWDPVANVALETTFLPGPLDAQPFQGDLLVTTVFGGDILRLDENLSPIGVVANVPGATGLAAKDGDAYVADPANGAILQIIDDGVVLDEPVMAFSGLDSPEGLDIRHNRMYVVEGGSETLTSIHLQSGKRKTIATDLGFQASALAELFPFGFLNNVTVSDTNDIYVNADRRNVIYEF